MSRGRKPKSKFVALSWPLLFKKNASSYLRIIINELSKRKAGNDESSLQLLGRIERERISLGRKETDLPPITAEEIPFPIPSNWIWCRLGVMSLNCDGARIPVSLAEREGRGKVYDYYGASGAIDKIDDYTHDGDFLLIGEDGANLKSKTTPIAFIVRGKFWVNNHAHVLNFIDDKTLEYMEYCLNAIDISSFITGGFQPKLSQGNLNMIPIPLPPLIDQENIVRFLNDLRDNKIKENGSYFSGEIEQIIFNLHNSQLLGSHISSELTNQLNLVKQLRQAFLREAMQGKLVRQDKSDEPASELLKKIKTEKEELIGEKKIKKEKELPPIKPEEIPFQIPENWAWCRLGELGRITGGGTPSMSRSDYWGGNIPWVSPKDMWVEYVSDSEMKITEKGVKESTTNLIPEGSILIVGRSGILKRRLPVAINKVECTVNQDMKVVIPYIVTMNRFIQLMLNGLEEIILAKFVKYGMTVHSLKYQEFEGMPIPLPPLSEQHRIVVKLEQLMHYCYQLEQSIKQSQTQNEQLLQQVLREALQPKKKYEFKDELSLAAED